MKLIMDDRVYTADTAVALIDEIKGEHWSCTKNTTAEEYIGIMVDTHKRMTGKVMDLSGDIEAQAIGMFEIVAKTGAWQFTKEE